MRRFTAVLRKDLRLELRSGESTIALLAIALLVLIVLVFALNPAGGNRDASMAGGALWIALIVAGMIGAGRALLAERDNGCIRALLLSPIDLGNPLLRKADRSFHFYGGSGSYFSRHYGAVFQPKLRLPAFAPGAFHRAWRPRLCCSRDLTGGHHRTRTGRRFAANLGHRPIVCAGSDSRR